MNCQRRDPSPPLPGMLLAALLPLLSGCDQPASNDRESEPEAAQPKTNRIDVPAPVRANLGIEFAKVERRRVASTLRLPARIELLPTAMRQHLAPLAGRVTLAVEPLQTVAAGDVLFTLDSAEWRRMQRELGERHSELEVSEARLSAMPPLLQACERHESSLRHAHEVTETFLGELVRAEQDVGGQSQRIANTRITLAQLAAQIAEADEKHVTTQTRIKELEAIVRSQRERLQLQLSGAAAALGVDVADLAAGDPGRERWRTWTRVEVRADGGGVVDAIQAANGALVNDHQHVLSVIDTTKIRCRAQALQSDLEQLREDLEASVVPTGSSGDPTRRIAGKLRLGPLADPRARTIDVFVEPSGSAPFARPGMAVYVEIHGESSELPELAVPERAVLQDGLERVFFRRDPRDADKVIRVIADLGRSDGRWIEVRSGLIDGDEVVTDGAYELVLASSQTSTKGGHFHADGTWHEDH